MRKKLHCRWRHLALRAKLWLVVVTLFINGAFTSVLALDDAYIPWGDSQHLGTNDTIVDTNFPIWLGAAFKLGAGVWDTNIPAWYVSSETTNEAALAVLFNPALLTNSLIMNLGFLDSSNSSLSLDLLLMKNQVMTTSNLVDNLLAGSGADTSRTFNVSLTATNAVGLQLRRGFGSILIRDTLLSPDSDGDEFSDTEELVWGSDPGSALSVPCGAITGQVYYAGVQPGVIYVQAATNADTWASAYYLTTTLPTNSQATPFILSGLPLRHPYFTRAWRDTDGNGSNDVGEAQGTNSPIWLNVNVSGITITLSDPDSDGDGMPDWWENSQGFNLHDALDAMNDTDGDGITNKYEYLRNTSPTNASDINIIIYVNADIGNDANFGLISSGTGSTGPKRTITSAFETAFSGDVVQAASGEYVGGATNWSVRNKTIRLVPNGTVFMK